MAHGTHPETAGASERAAIAEGFPVAAPLAFRAQSVALVLGPGLPEVRAQHEGRALQATVGAEPVERATPRSDPDAQPVGIGFLGREARLDGSAPPGFVELRIGDACTARSLL